MSNPEESTPSETKESKENQPTQEQTSSIQIVEPVLNPDSRVVTAFIRDKSFTINIADGSQTVDWLADVVLFKYKRSQFEKMNCRGVKYHNKLLDMQMPIAAQVENGHEVYILLEGDEDVDQMFGDEI